MPQVIIERPPVINPDNSTNAVQTADTDALKITIADEDIAALFSGIAVVKEV